MTPQRVGPPAPRAALALVVALLMPLLVTRPASAQTSGEKTAAPTTQMTMPLAPTDAQRREAKERFDRGLVMYREGDLQLALLQFERAHELVPLYRVLYNIGQVQQQLRMHARAAVTLERYLREGGDDIPPDRRAAVERDLESLRSRIGRVHVAVNVPGAEVSIGGRVVARAPMSDGVLVDAGEQRVSVASPGYATEFRTIVLAGGDESTVSVTLVRPVDPVTASVAAEAARRPTNTRAIALWATTGALGVGTGVLGYLALDSAKSLAASRVTYGTPQSERDVLKTRATSLALATDIVGALTVVSLGAATYFTLRPAPATSGHARTLGVSPTVGGVVVSGQF